MTEEDGLSVALVTGAGSFLVAHVDMQATMILASDRKPC
jgi:hypothetical protein